LSRENTHKIKKVPRSPALKDFKFAKNQDCSTLEFAHAAIYHHLLAFKCHYPLDYYDYYGSKDLFS